ncbi:hypothetical protein C8A00DRAFT_34100 [Chaetomidium leptoderma]|uniref:Uncharacterized protein n=1 Tax=Chaetomidium leptoderma TaxID=669021 RepID=A0AAN6ZV68_9PEZI|nr:hypothetical protein C8A00DRAFT_34100 [Chaetomidium leptoderma]
MEPGAQYLTLKLLVFEVTNGNRTLTDAAAEGLVLLFGPDSAWRSSIRRVDVAGIDHHYELQLVHHTIVRGHDSASRIEAQEAIEELCRQFCDPNGVLCPRRINPNPNLIFTVGVDLNSPTDDMFLCSFIKHNARSESTAGLDTRRDSRAMSSVSGFNLTPAATAWLKNILTAVFRSGAADQDIVPAMISSAELAAVQGLVDLAGSKADAKHVALGEQMGPSINQAVDAFAHLRDICTENGIEGISTPMDLTGTKHHLERLRDAMLAVAREQEGAESEHRNARRAASVYGLFLALALGGTFLHPGVGAALAANFSDFGPAFEGLLKASSVLVVPVVSVLQGKGFLDAGKAKHAGDMLGSTKKIMHRKLFMVVLDAMRSDYRHRPDAGRFAKFVMEMAAAVNPAALKKWDHTTTSHGWLDCELNESVKDWVQPGPGQ